MIVRCSWNWLQVLLCAGFALGCDPYPNWEGDFHAGPVDPIQFAPPYLGEGGDRFRTGSGTFTAAAAFVSGNADEYFAFPFSEDVLPADGSATDALLVLSDGEPAPGVTLPLSYVFDPSEDSPFPSDSRCQKPENYSYDLARDGIRLDEQGNIFTALPVADYRPGVDAKTSYSPLVRQVPVASNGVKCQEPKSEDSVVTRGDVTLEKRELIGQKFEGIPDGRFLAWAIIDPSAAVYHANEGPTTPPTPETAGIGIQRIGWFNHFLLAYLDGGYIPTTETTVSTAEGDVTEVRLVAQKLYVPRSQVITNLGTADEATAAGELGQGYDVLEFARGRAGYSPICEVWTYDVGADTAIEALPKTAADIEATYAATLEPGEPRYFFCLQTE